MNQLLKTLALSGGEWVIYLLAVCSVVTVAVIMERWLHQRREMRSLARLNREAPALLEKGDWAALSSVIGQAPGSAARILMAGVDHAGKSLPALEEYAAAARAVEKKRLEERLLILGTLGNNAPFIGLFGTVLGVIKAFHDLSETAAGPEVIMQGLSEALVATAVGLLVAIPAVMAYNYFQKRVSDLLTDAESLLRLLLARLKEEAPAKK